MSRRMKCRAGFYSRFSQEWDKTASQRQYNEYGRSSPTRYPFSLKRLIPLEDISNVRWVLAHHFAGLRVKRRIYWTSRKKVRRRATDFLLSPRRKISAFGIGISFATWANVSGKSWCLFRLAAIGIYCKPRG